MYVPAIVICIVMRVQCTSSVVVVLFTVYVLSAYPLGTQYPYILSNFNTPDVDCKHFKHFAMLNVATQSRFVFL
jgi:hypothetical protein